MKETPIKFSELVHYTECDGRYFMLKYTLMGSVVNETRLFNKKSNLNTFLNLNERLFTRCTLWVVDEDG